MNTEQESGTFIPDLLTSFSEREAQLHDELSTIGKARAALEDMVEPARPAKPKPQAKVPKPKRRSFKWSRPAVKPEEIRDFIVGQRRFTRKEIADHFGRSRSWTQNALDPFLQRGIAAVLDEKGEGGEQIMEYQPPTSTGGVATATKVRGAAKGGPVPGTGNRRLSSDKEIRPLLKAAENQGFSVEHGRSHITVRNRETGASRRISSSPSDRNAPKKVKRELRQIGVSL